MEKTKIKLDGIHLAFAKKMFIPLESYTVFAWLPYTLITLIGCFIIYALPEKWIGGLLIGLGIVGAMFFKSYSNKTSFEIKPHLYTHKGVLSTRLKGAGRIKLFTLFVDDYPLIMPHVLEHYGVDLSKKHNGKPVTVTLALMSIKHSGKSEFVYTALKIADDLCIKNAISRHGKYLFLKDSIYSIFLVILFMVLVIMFWIGAEFITNKIESIIRGDLVFGLLIIIGVIFSGWIVNKIAPSNNIKSWYKMLACENNTAFDQTK